MITQKDDPFGDTMSNVERMEKFMAWRWGYDLKKAPDVKRFDYSIDTIREEYYREIRMLDESNSDLTRPDNLKRRSQLYKKTEEISAKTIMFLPVNLRKSFKDIVTKGFSRGSLPFQRKIIEASIKARAQVQHSKAQQSYQKKLQDYNIQVKQQESIPDDKKTRLHPPKECKTFDKCLKAQQAKISDSETRSRLLNSLKLLLYCRDFEFLHCMDSSYQRELLRDILKDAEWISKRGAFVSPTSKKIKNTMCPSAKDVMQFEVKKYIKRTAWVLLLSLFPRLVGLGEKDQRNSFSPRRFVKLFQKRFGHKPSQIFFPTNEDNFPLFDLLLDNIPYDEPGLRLWKKFDNFGDVLYKFGREYGNYSFTEDSFNIHDETESVDMETEEKTETKKWILFRNFSKNIEKYILLKTSIFKKMENEYATNTSFSNWERDCVEWIQQKETQSEEAKDDKEEHSDTTEARPEELSSTGVAQIPSLNIRAMAEKYFRTMIPKWRKEVGNFVDKSSIKLTNRSIIIGKEENLWNSLGMDTYLKELCAMFENDAQQKSDGLDGGDGDDDDSKDEGPSKKRKNDDGDDKVDKKKSKKSMLSKGKEDVADDDKKKSKEFMKSEPEEHAMSTDQSDVELELDDKHSLLTKCKFLASSDTVTLLDIIELKKMATEVVKNAACNVETIECPILSWI